MFEKLATGIQKSLHKLKGNAQLSRDNIQDCMREIRLSLLEADVSLEVIKSILANLQEKVIGTEVAVGLTPAQVFIQKLQEEIETLLGSEQKQLKLQSDSLVKLLIVGVQGTGKTTSLGKLAKNLQETGKKVALASMDTQRKAASRAAQDSRCSSPVRIY